MSTTIKIPVEIDATINEEENTTPRQLISNLLKGNGPYLILAQQLPKPIEEGRPISYTPSGTTITIYQEHNKHLIWKLKEFTKGVVLSAQEQQPGKEKIRPQQYANYYPHLIEAMRLIINKNYKLQNKELISNQNVFKDLEALTNFLVKCNIITSSKSDFAIEGEVSDIKRCDETNWYQANGKEFGEGNASFYVTLRAHLDREFGIKNLKTYDVDFHTEIYLRRNYSLYKDRIRPIIHTIGELAQEQKISFDFFDHHNVDKIIANEESMKFRTFEQKGNIQERLDDFVEKIERIYNGLYAAINEEREINRKEIQRLAQKYFLK